MTNPELEDLLATWRVTGPPLIELRRLHACALNDAVAWRCAERSGARGIPGQPGLSADVLRRRVRGSTWTTPELAFAHYVGLARSETSGQSIRRIVASLLDVASREAPRFDLREAGGGAEWQRYGLTTLVADYRRDRRRLEIEPAEPADADLAACWEALEILASAWPEMAFAIDSLVREVVWFEAPDGTGSGTVIQAYGAVFLARGGTVAQALERLVHETTHLEVIARLAVDRVVLNPRDEDTSPFRSRPRPLTRVLHAAIVAIRVIEAFDPTLDDLAPGECDRAAAMRSRLSESLDEALDALERSARWTGLGTRLFEDLVDGRDRVRRIGG